MIWNFSKQVEANFCERQFFKKVAEKLSILDDSYNLIITCCYDETLDLYNKDKKNIVIYLSDEYGIFKNWFNKVDLIFRTYPRKGFFDNKQIFPIPLGLVMPDFVTYKMEQPKNKLSERKYDYFYSGQISPNRTQFVNQIKNVVKQMPELNGIIKETNGFRTGFSIDEYYEIMNETKISFVPLGKVIPESFRYMESFESGCVVVTDFPLHMNKDIWYYKNSSAFLVGSYSQINPTSIRKILDNIDTYGEKSINYYNNYLSTDATSKFIIETINNKFV